MSGPETVQERNKALAARWFEEAWNKGNTRIAPEIFHQDFVLNGEQVGPSGPQQSVQFIRSVFGSLKVTIELQVAEGPYVITRYSTSSRHTAGYRGLEPSGKWVSAPGVQIWRVVDGLVVEDMNLFDEWSLVNQLSEVSLSPGA